MSCHPVEEDPEQGSSMNVYSLRKRKNSVDHSKFFVRNKKAKLAKVKRDFSELPTEILLKIFGYIKKEDKCMKNIVETCSRFNAICGSRLKLKVNFNRLIGSNKVEYPVIQRKYETIVLTGFEIDPDVSNLQKILNSSKETATCLHISALNQSCKIKAHVRTLMWIMNFLSQLQEFNGWLVQAYGPILKFDAIEKSEYPRLRSLKVVHLNDCNDPILHCLMEVDTIEDFQILGNIFGNFQKRLKTVTMNQLNIKTLRTVLNDIRTKHEFQHLDTLILPAMVAYQVANTTQNLIKNAPHLKNLKLLHSRHDYGRQEYPLQEWINFSLPSLQTLELDGRVDENFNLYKMLANLPALKSFKSSNCVWEAPKKSPPISPDS